MPSPAFTPGEGGGKPAKPESENVWEFPWLIPQPQPEPIPDRPPLPIVPPATTQEESTSTQSPHLDFGNPPPSPPSTTPEQEESTPPPPKKTDSVFVAGGTGFSAASNLPDYVVTEENLRNIRELRGETGPLRLPSNLIEMEAYLAARQNPLLHEVLIFTQHEGIPPALEGNVEKVLELFGENGIDVADTAEAKAYLMYRMYGGLSHYHEIDPLDTAWKKAHDVYDPKADYSVSEPAEIANYRTEIEMTFGITFTWAVGAKPWDMLGLRSAHIAFEKLASALGESVRRRGFYWDDATAFREIMGEITLHNSVELPPRSKDDGTILAIAKVEGRTIKVFWKDDADGRNFHVNPNLMLHELGHIYNTNVGLGSPFSPVSINKTTDHPETRAGMGSPEPSVLRGKKTIYSSHSSTGLPEYYQVIGVSSPDDKIFANMPSYLATQILSLQQSTDPSPNEITADAILNWSYDQTSDQFGFTEDLDGLTWQAFMSGNMDDWIPYAIAYNILMSGAEITLTEAERNLMPFPLPVGRGVTAGPKGPRVRSGPSTDYDNVSGGLGLPLGMKVIVLGRNEQREDDKFLDWVAVLYRGNINWIYKDGVQLPDGMRWDDLPIIKNNDELDFGDDSPLLNIESWFPILFKAAYGR